MRWEPKPYKLNGWEFQFNGDEITAIPKIDELQKKISEAVKNLSLEVARAENLLMLSHLTDDTLEGLAKLCKNELKRRKKMRDDFKL